MEFTGERMIPEFNENQDIYLEHTVRYAFTEQFVLGKVVLDIACGSGYGSATLIKAGAKKVIGVDIAEETIGYCKKTYNNENLEFMVGGVQNIPAEDNSVDVIVSFETIEHVDADAQRTFIGEVRRVLKKDGTFIVSTPNMKVFPKGNHFHVHELEREEFDALLRSNFSNFVMSCVFNEEMLEETDALENDMVTLKKLDALKKEEMQFFVAICSDAAIDVKKNYLSFSSIRPWMAYKWYEGIISNNRRNIEELTKQDGKSGDSLYGLLQQRDREIFLMKSSKFWKIRNAYLKMKNVLFK